jgi:hypothetical protein
VLICDAKCDKAWGINGRPHVQLSDDEDDYESLADSELGEAPGPGETVGVSEGSDMKPATIPQRLNRWCARECERSSMPGYNQPFELKDYSKRVPNMPHRRAGNADLPDSG